MSSRTYRDAGRRVAKWVSRFARGSSGIARGVRLDVGWIIASPWLVGLLIMVTLDWQLAPAWMHGE